MTKHEIADELDMCEDGVQHISKHDTLLQAFEECKEPKWLIWLSYQYLFDEEIVKGYGVITTLADIVANDNGIKRKTREYAGNISSLFYGDADDMNGWEDNDHYDVLYYLINMSNGIDAMESGARIIRILHDIHNSTTVDVYMEEIASMLRDAMRDDVKSLLDKHNIK